MRSAVIIVVLCLACLTSVADNTLSRRLRVRPARAEVAVSLPDTLRGAPCDSVLLSGYDKPLRASRETLFVTNRLDVPLTAVGIRLIYSDMSGRLLHRRTVCARVLLEPGETRMVSIPTWDTNRSFFYHRGARPRVSGVTPYGVDAAVDYCVTDNQTEQ